MAPSPPWGTARVSNVPCGTWPQLKLQRETTEYQVLTAVAGETAVDPFIIISVPTEAMEVDVEK